MSGAIAQSQKIDTIANNIANASTPAFKRDEQVFKEYLTSYEQASQELNVPKVPASMESFYDTQGSERTPVANVGTFTDHSQGSFKTTGNPLDLAINGNGYFEVLTPRGVRLTRAGAFRVDQDGRLVTRNGDLVLQRAEGTNEPQGREVRLTNSPVTIDNSGQIIQDGEPLATLSVVNVVEPTQLRKEGQLLYMPPEAANILNAPGGYTVQQGTLELSNVEVIKEMSDLIQAHRVFDTNQRAVKAYDAMSEKIANTIPRLD